MAEYIRKYTTAEQLLTALKARMGWIEGMDLRIQDTYLHPDCVDLIKLDPQFERIAQMSMLRLLPGIVGVLWGMRVYKSTLVPPEHVAFIPDGIEGKLTGSEACIAL